MHQEKRKQDQLDLLYLQRKYFRAEFARGVVVGPSSANPPLTFDESNLLVLDRGEASVAPDNRLLLATRCSISSGQAGALPSSEPNCSADDLGVSPPPTDAGLDVDADTSAHLSLLAWADLEPKPKISAPTTSEPPGVRCPSPSGPEMLLNVELCPRILLASTAGTERCPSGKVVNEGPGRAPSDKAGPGFDDDDDKDELVVSGS